MDEASLAGASQMEAAASAALVAQLSQLRVEVHLRRGAQTNEAAPASKSAETCQRLNQDLQYLGFHCSPSTSSSHLLFAAPPLRPSQLFPIGGAAAAAAPLLVGRRPASAPTSRPASAASVRPARASRPATAAASRSTSAAASRPPSAAQARPSSAPASRANARTSNAKVGEAGVAGDAAPEIVLQRTSSASHLLSSTPGYASPKLSHTRRQRQRAAGVNSSGVGQRVAPFAFDASQPKPTPIPSASGVLRTKTTQGTSHFSFLVQHLAVRCGQDKPAAGRQMPAC